MPMPLSVEPMPPVPRLSRLGPPLDAHEASYLAASAKILSLSRSSICSTYVLVRSRGQYGTAGGGAKRARLPLGDSHGQARPRLHLPGLRGDLGQVAGQVRRLR